MNIAPVILTGKHIVLEPLTESHIDALSVVGSDPSIWEYMLYGQVTTTEKMGVWVRDMLSRQAAGADLPFAIRHLESGNLAGATRYMEIKPQHRSLEIGGSWLGTQYQRTIVNTEAKYLMLAYAFESLGCIRVQFKTDSRNERSFKAIEKIGAVREGTLRNHMILESGVFRHSVFFSIIDSEWPTVKQHLEEKIYSYS